MSEELKISEFPHMDVTDPTWWAAWEAFKSSDGPTDYDRLLDALAAAKPWILKAERDGWTFDEEGSTDEFVSPRSA